MCVTAVSRRGVFDHGHLPPPKVMQVSSTSVAMYETTQRILLVCCPTQCGRRGACRVTAPLPGFMTETAAPLGERSVPGQNKSERDR